MLLYFWSHCIGTHENGGFLSFATKTPASRDPAPPLWFLHTSHLLQTLQWIEVPCSCRRSSTGVGAGLHSLWRGSWCCILRRKKSAASSRILAADLRCLLQSGELLGVWMVFPQECFVVHGVAELDYSQPALQILE